MIKATSLSFTYPGNPQPLATPAMKVATGETVAIIGPSGCGKSTFLNLLCGVLKPNSGAVEIAGQPLASMTDREIRAFRASTVGFVFQDFGLLDYLRVLDNIIHPYRLSSALRLSVDTRQRAQGLAERVGIRSLLDRTIDQLSHGERQRVAICRALLTEPRLILADEATGNLDPASKQAIMELLFGLVRESNTTLVAVTHDHELLDRFDRIIDFAALRAAS